MHLLDISTFSVNNVIVRLTKIKFSSRKLFFGKIRPILDTEKMTLKVCTDFEMFEEVVHNFGKYDGEMPYMVSSQTKSKNLERSSRLHESILL